MTLTPLLYVLIAVAAVIGALILLKLVCWISLKLFKLAFIIVLLIGCGAFAMWLFSL